MVFDRHNLGKKLKETRQALGLTLENVAAKLGFSNYQTLSTIESGEREVKALELSELAKIYFKDIAYFLLDKPSVQLAVLWREKLPTPLTKEKENQFLKLCEDYYYLEQKLGLPSSPGYKEHRELIADYKQAENLAIDLAKEMALGSKPACSIRNILEENYNIKIFFLDLSGCGSGASATGDFGSAILINSSEAPWRQNFDLAHEFFHLITWNTFKQVFDDPNMKEKQETFANKFAACLLLPADEITREFNTRAKDGSVNFNDCIDIAREFEVSTDALLYRLAELKLISHKEASRVLKETSFKRQEKEIRKADRAEKTPPPRLPSRFVFLAFQCFQKGHISRGKLAEYLGVDRQALHDHLLENYGYDDQKEEYDIELTAA